MDYLDLTDTLDLDAIKPSRVFPGTSNTCGLVTDVSQEHCGAVCDPSGENCDISDSCTSNSDGATADVSVALNGQSGYDSRAVQDIGPKTKVLHLLKEYNEDTRRKVFKTKMFECKVCFLDKLGANCLEFWPCRHVYCKDCMASFFSVQISEGNIKFLRCPEEKCDSEANPKQVGVDVAVCLFVLIKGNIARRKFSNVSIDFFFYAT